MMHTLETVVREQPFFQGMRDQDIQLIAGCSMNLRFDAASMIFRAGEPADCFYLIRDGQVAVQLPVPHKGMITVQTLGEGEVLGWFWLLPPHRWHFGARVPRTTRALVFDGKYVRTKCDQDHDLGYAIYTRFREVAARRLQATLLQLTDLYDIPGLNAVHRTASSSGRVEGLRIPRAFPANGFSLEPRGSDSITRLFADRASLRSFAEDQQHKSEDIFELSSAERTAAVATRAPRYRTAIRTRDGAEDPVVMLNKQSMRTSGRLGPAPNMLFLRLARQWSGISDLRARRAVYFFTTPAVSRSCMGRKRRVRCPV